MIVGSSVWSVLAMVSSLMVAAMALLVEFSSSISLHLCLVASFTWFSFCIFSSVVYFVLFFEFVSSSIVYLHFHQVNRTSKIVNTIQLKLS